MLVVYTNNPAFADKSEGGRGGGRGRGRLGEMGMGRPGGSVARVGRWGGGKRKVGFLERYPHHHRDSLLACLRGAQKRAFGDV